MLISSSIIKILLRWKFDSSVSVYHLCYRDYCTVCQNFSLKQ